LSSGVFNGSDGTSCTVKNVATSASPSLSPDPEQSAGKDTKKRKRKRAPRAQSLILTTGTAKKGRPHILHDRAMAIIGATNNMTATLFHRTLGDSGKKEQSDMITDICHELGQISNYEYSNLLRDLNPDGVTVPLTELTEDNQKAVNALRQAFVVGMHTVSIIDYQLTLQLLNFSQSVQSRLAQLVRDATPRETKRREEELRTMALLAGESTHVINFDKWHINHVVHGWSAKIEAAYYAQHKAVPTGKYAASLRARYCSEFLATKEDPEIVRELRKEHDQLKKDMRALQDGFCELTEDDSGYELSVEQRHM
jgi:hypothetical protein